MITFAFNCVESPSFEPELEEDWLDPASYMTSARLDGGRLHYLGTVPFNCVLEGVFVNFGYASSGNYENISVIPSIELYMIAPGIADLAPVANTLVIGSTIHWSKNKSYEVALKADLSVPMAQGTAVYLVGSLRGMGIDGAISLPEYYFNFSGNVCFKEDCS